MRVGIMQPYFLPYIGYWQLIHAVDVFVVYDNIKYTKKGWINRNRFLLHGRDAVFSLPLRKDSDFLNVNERQLAESFSREELLNRFKHAYRKAPFFGEIVDLLEEIVNHPSGNLFDYVFHSIQSVCDHLGIKTRLVVSSSVPCDHSLKSVARVQSICQALGASAYINPIGGTELYSKQEFAEHGLHLSFLKSCDFEYPQGNLCFVPWLSILDVLMFNSRERIRDELAQGYTFT